MAYGRAARFEPLREVAFGAITANYTAVGTLTTDFTRLFTISNATDVDVYISFDGVTNHLRVVTGTAKVYDITSNKVRDDGLFIPKGTVFSIKRVAGAPSSGQVSIEVMYAGSLVPGAGGV